MIHPSEAERTAALAEAGAAGDLVIADTREHVASLNAAIRDQRRAELAAGDSAPDSMVTARGERIGLGDRVATRRNDPDLGVANRQTWTVTGLGDDGSLLLHAADAIVRSRRSTRTGSSSSPTPPPSTEHKARPSTEPTSPSARPPAPLRRTSR